MTQSVETTDDLKYDEISYIPSERQMGDVVPEIIYVRRDISYDLNNECDTKVEFAYMLDGKICGDVTVDALYVDFKMYAEKIDNNVLNSENESDDSTTMSTDEEFGDNDVEQLDYTCEIVPEGVLINSMVYLSDNNWNTLLEIDHTLGKCVVCDIYISLDSPDKHIASFSHNMHITHYKPLNKYRLNIIRMVFNIYHCAHCNELLQINEIDNHLDSDNHKKLIILAINKAITKSDDIERNNNNNDVKINDAIRNDGRDSNNESFTYASVAKKPKPMEMPEYVFKDLGTKEIKVSFDSWNMISPTPVNTLHCVACNKTEHMRFKAEHCASVRHLANLKKCIVIEDFKEHLIRLVPNSGNFYHCGHCNNVQWKSEIELHLDIMHHTKKKSNEQIPLNLSNNHVSIRRIFDSDANNDKNAVSSDKKAVTNDNKAVSSDNKDLTNDKNDLTNVKKDLTNDKKAASNDKNDVTDIEKAPCNAENTEIKGNTCLKDAKILIQPFGYNILISVLPYNTIIKRRFDYFCGLCGKTLELKDVRSHIEEPAHLHLLQTTAFIQFYGDNLIRAVTNFFHCTICNIVLLPLNIIAHNRHQDHRILLSNTLNIPLEKLPLFNPPVAMEPPPFQNPYQLPYAPQMLPYGPQMLPYPPQMIPYGPQMLLYRPILGMPNPVQNIQYMPNNVSLNPSAHPFSPQIVVNRVQSQIDDVSDTANKCGDIGKSTKDSEAQCEIETKIETPKAEVQNVDTVKEEKEKTTKLKRLSVSECQFIGIQSEDKLDESTDSENAFNTEEYVYLQLKNVYTKITFTSYNTLVVVGDGTRYCFVCAGNIGKEIKKHVDSRLHLENMDKYHFVDKYEKHLFRQSYLTYHCSICNVLLSQHEIKKHIDWTTHTLEMDIAHSTVKKTRRRDIESGVKHYAIKTVKEEIYLNTKPKQSKCLMNVAISKSLEETHAPVKGKMISFKNNVLKFSFDNWNSITAVRKGIMRKCIICDVNIETNLVMMHVKLDSHRQNLTKIFEKKYFPALIRQVNETKSHCIFCNVKLLNTHINVHIKGGRHEKNYEANLQNSASPDTYADCEEEMLVI